MKKGDKIKFNFHGFGVVSQEDTIITEVNDNYFQISHGEPEYRFNKKTGKCLNDNTDMGCYRTVSKEYLT